MSTGSGNTELSSSCKMEHYTACGERAHWSTNVDMSCGQTAKHRKQTPKSICLWFPLEKVQKQAKLIMMIKVKMVVIDGRGTREPPGCWGHSVS